MARRDRFVTVDGTELHYAVWGDPDAPTVVCLHGGWQNADAWRPQVDRFADEYRVVTVDFRGHGRTGATDARRYSIDLFVDDVDALLAHLGVEEPILCGLSMGGMVVQSFLAAYPRRARAAVVGGPIRSMPPVDLPAGVKAAVSPVPTIAGLASTIGTRATFESLCRSITATTGRPWLTVDAGVRAEALAAVDDVTPGEYRKIFRALYRFESPDFSAVRTPTLVLYGDHEAPSVKRQGERLAHAVENGSYTEVDDAGHLVNRDRPAAFNDACAALFDGVASSRRDPSR
ncbi:MAG: alpha/beta fold hydrolase [Haloplanus sp.]